MTLSEDSDRRPRRSKSVTIIDLIVLVLGVALALSMAWAASWEGHPAMRQIPDWNVKGEFVEEGLEKACLALIPLLLWRRVRLGGVCRPAELLLVACGTPRLVDDLDWAIFAAEGKLEFPNQSDLGDLFWTVRAVVGASVVASILGLFLGRDRLGDRARSILLMVIAGSFPWLLNLLDNIQVVTVEANQLEGWSEVAVAVVCGTIKYLVPGIIGAAAVFDLIRRRGRLGAMEWAGLILATTDVAVALPVNLWGYFMPSIPPAQEIKLHVTYFGGPIVAAILGVLLLAILGPAWNRATGPSKDANSGG